MWQHSPRLQNDVTNTLTKSNSSDMLTEEDNYCCRRENLGLFQMASPMAIESLNMYSLSASSGMSPRRTPKKFYDDTNFEVHFHFLLFIVFVNYYYFMFILWLWY